MYLSFFPFPTTFICSLKGKSEKLNCRTSDTLKPVAYIKYSTAISLLCCHLFQFPFTFGCLGSKNLRKFIKSSSLKVLF